MGEDEFLSRVLQAWLGQGRKNLTLQSLTPLKTFALGNYLIPLSSLNTTKTLMFTFNFI
jgi:hypothetical protein